MAELRVNVTEKLNKLLDEVVAAGLFATKADTVRAATVYFLKDLGWIKSLRDLRCVEKSKDLGCVEKSKEKGSATG